MQPNHSRNSLKICHSYVVQAVSPTAYACPTVCLSVGLSNCPYVSLSVRLSLSVLLSPCTSNTPLAKDLINVARNVAETANMSEKHHQTVGTYFEQLFHLLAGHLSAPLPLLLLLLLLLLVLVLHSFVY